MIAATGADYLALGHWDRPMQVGDGTVPAGQEEKARQAVANCPEYAITLVDD